ncbi:MAG: hypothetical protein JO154_07855 [Chitinophaga sp.]|uniref:hypothetical protein n=1 Tax=Chitinophaga sp. TaxID=1869181 RepID=UPI0025C02F3F|nr:hypothetical protein [Chitinophaga sp.]MBV8252507.1 hypothetical protein [Chitinophaga sp.]
MRFYFAAFLLLANLQLAAQQFGGNPSSLKWQQINTDTVRVIFPKGMSQTGERVANIVTYLNRNTRQSIGNRQQKVSIVLQNQTMESNGYVALGPFRSEFYLTPPPTSFDLGSLNWAEQLSLHEYRHVLQNMNFRQGVSKVASWVGGQLGQAAATNIAVPNWFWEGDAVTMETALSNQGRGRLPAFFDGFRALSLANKDYRYMKIRGGSYKDFLPNHYPLGYLMSIYGRDHYGPTFWKDVTRDAVRYRSVFYPMSRAIKRRTGMNVTGFYHAMISHYDSIWNAWAQRPAITPVRTVSPKAKVYTDYKYMYSAGNHDFIVLKGSWNKVPAFYLLRQDGSEELLTYPGIVFDDYFSYRNNRIVWAAARFDVRWSWKELSVIRVYDRNTGHTSTVTGRGKFFSPDINNDGSKIIATVVSPEMKYSLQLINAETGTVEKELPNPDNWYFANPRFTAGEDAVIAAARDKSGKMALVQQSLTTGQITTLSDFSFNVIGAPTIYGDTAYFIAGGKDVNNVYAMTLSDRKTYQVTDLPNSALFAAPNQDSLLFSEFTDKGYKLFQSSLSTTNWKPADLTVRSSSAWLNPEFHEGGNVLSTVPHDSLPVEKYRKTTGTFNFHSWVPSFNDPEYSISLLGNNVLNTTATSVGYTYNKNEGTSDFGASFLYGGWFPWLGTGVDYTINKSGYTSKGQLVYWNQLSWHAGFTIPLNFSSGLYGRSLTLSSNYYIQQLYANGLRFRVNPQQYASTALVFNNQRIRAAQNIYSHFGQYLVLQYNNSIGGARGNQFYGRFDLSLPGLSRNHSLVLQAAYQRHDTLGNYSFTDRFVYARGYNKPFYNRIYKLGANYHFPLWYPDWGFAQIMYISRVRANAFFDYSRANDYIRHVDNTYRSTGGELYLDTKLGNTIPFTFGMRMSYLLDPDPVDNAKVRVDFILPLQQLFSY